MATDSHYQSVARREWFATIILGILTGVLLYLMTSASLFLAAVVTALPFIGSICNTLAILANGGYMPVSVKDSFSRQFVFDNPRHIAIASDTKLRFLADRFHLSARLDLLSKLLGRPIYIKAVFSLGDLLMLLSVPLVVVAVLVDRIVRV